MSKHIKTICGRPVAEPKQKNWQRRQRRKRKAARVAAERESMLGWADRSPSRNTAEMSV